MAERLVSLQVWPVTDLGFFKGGAKCRRIEVRGAEGCWLWGGNFHSPGGRGLYILNLMPWNGIFWCILARYYKHKRPAIARSKTCFADVGLHHTKTGSLSHWPQQPVWWYSDSERGICRIRRRNDTLHWKENVRLPICRQYRPYLINCCFWENRIFCILATDRQTNSIDALSRSRYRERRLNKDKI